MLTGLGALPGALVVRRGGTREFDADQASTVKTAYGEALRLQKVASEDG